MAGPAPEPRLVSFHEITAARRTLATVVRPTPTTFSHSLSRHVGQPVWLKPEQRQRTGSFKIRGAYHLQSQLPVGASVVAASAGNHAQGVALAASLLGQHATIFMPRGASLPKVQATRAYGAEVVLVGATIDDCIVEARAAADERQGTFVPPFDHPQVIAGQGTIGLEILDEAPDVATVVVAIGGGGLCSGIGAAVKRVRPDVRVIGVVAEGAASMLRSLDAGRPLEVSPHTVADGIALRAPSQLTLDHVTAFVDDVVVVSDEDISAATLLLLERVKAVVEPAGAAALAALLGGSIDARGPVAAVLGGGNVDPVLLGKVVDHGLSVAGRYLVLRVVVDDRPGTLAGLTESVATLGLNVLAVEHHRSGLRLDLGSVEVQITVETRDHEHRREVVAALEDMGYAVEVVE
ncbi:MAG TPA: threonine ammonia-lyase [Microthrixaceae bacterium]|nr:threonine ammonia-lyase [Microthrixaceae bacterium]